jgi:hypothetical protein
MFREGMAVAHRLHGAGRRLRRSPDTVPLNQPAAAAAAPVEDDHE